MYEKIEVWKRVENNYVIRFLCVRRLSDGLFAVQNADFFRTPLSISSIHASDQRFLELFFEEDPAERCHFWRASFVEAISDHESYFSEMP